jgi:DNA modification methylase
LDEWSEDGMAIARTIGRTPKLGVAPIIRVAEPIGDPVLNALRVDLNFPGPTREFTHGIHSFAARFPPLIPRHFIQALSKPGDVVLDPMSGSGTTILEAALSGRQGIGVDLDPLAVLLSRSKSKVVDPTAVEEAGKRVLASASDRLLPSSPLYTSEREVLSHVYEGRKKEFFEYWFKPRTVLELHAILSEIRRVKDVDVRRALMVAFSSMIITKSAGVSLSRDLAHTRPHMAHGKIPESAVALFPKTVRKVATGLASLSEAVKERDWVTPNVVRGDATHLPLRDESVGLVVTSPPYATALDYMRAHKFTLSWLGFDMDYLTQLRSQYIGTETAGDFDGVSSYSAGLERLLPEIADKDRARARTISLYFSAMRDSFSELLRVVKPGASVVVVVGDSSFKQVEISTHAILAEIAKEVGFTVKAVKEREIDRNSRQLPTSFHSAKNGIEARIHREFILCFVKPPTVPPS